MKIGFIGAGQMATALASGFAAGDESIKLAACDPRQEAIANIKNAIGDSAFSTCSTCVELAQMCDVVVIAVKPQVIESALAGLNEVFEPGKTYVSIVAGVSLRRLQELTGSSQVIRTMPNTPCLIGSGAIAMVAGESVPQESIDSVRALFSQVGLVVDVTEPQMNAVTGLSGSGPAYVYTFIESLVDGGVLAGLPREVAHELAVQTVLGAAQMALKASEHPSVLRDQVTSPGGTTIHGMAELEKGWFSFKRPIRCAGCNSQIKGVGPVICGADGPFIKQQVLLTGESRIGN